MSEYKLSIIIPYYNAKIYCDELLKGLSKQITDEVQVILVDDGSKIKYRPRYKWLTVIRQENGGASSARNTGLDNATGEYIAFIDSDDLVPDNYIKTILDKINQEAFDFCYLSWKSFGGWQCEVLLKNINDTFPKFNLCCWNRIYRREPIKDIRFNESKLIAEDAEFIKEAESRFDKNKKSFIGDIMYLYRSDTPNSLTKRFDAGELPTKRVVYNYKHITSDMTYLLDEMKNLYKDSEIIVMTEKNDIPEIENYAMVTTPIKVKGTSFRGEPTSLYTHLNMPIKTQIVIYTNETFFIGGIETFIYNFCMQMKDEFDITVVYNKMAKARIDKLSPFVKVIKNNPARKIYCNVLINNRITDSVPSNINYSKKIQMVHACKLKPEWRVRDDNDVVVSVSNVVKDSYGENIDNQNNIVINNFTYPQTSKKALTLISATRLSFEKGEKRMIAFAKKLKENNIPFVWYLFTERPLKEMVDGMVVLKPTLDIESYIMASDYLVQFSDSEGFGYSIVEALELGTPVICCDIPILSEIGVEDGVNSIVLPLDMKDIDVNKIYNTKLDFSYEYNNKDIKKKWKKILGSMPKVAKINLDSNLVVVKALKRYKDVQLNRMVRAGEVYSVSKERASEIAQKHLCEILY